VTSATIGPGAVCELQVVTGLTRTQIVQYAGASGDFNPLHTDEVFVRDTAGLNSVFAHGMLTMGMTGRVLTDWFGAENIVSYAARFVAQVWPGDALIARAVVDDIVTTADHRELTVTLTTTNQHGQLVLSGTAVVREPSASAEPGQRLDHDA
jgi:acyl dehydratase